MQFYIHNIFFEDFIFEINILSIRDRLGNVINHTCKLSKENTGYIGRINADNSITIYNVQESIIENEQANEEQESEYSAMMIEQIQNRIAVVATDAAMKENYIAIHWIVTTKNNKEEITGGVKSTKWREG